MIWLLANFKLVLIGALLAAIIGYVLHAEHAKKRLAQSIALAEEQQRANAKQALRDIKNKERSDENYQRNMARLASDVKRLRNARASLLPPTVPGAANTDRACFSRSEFDAALQRYRAGVIGLLSQGAAAIEGLDEAKAWARDR